MNLGMSAKKHEHMKNTFICELIDIKRNFVVRTVL